VFELVQHILEYKPSFQENRRSTRVQLSLTIRVEAESLSCEGETVVVNLHGAFIRTAVPLKADDRITVQAYLTGKRASARVVYVSPTDPLLCGIELAEPINIWGVSLLPEHWQEQESIDVER
jgi:hypothetical protein